MQLKTQGVFFVRSLVELVGGDINSALMLSQIFYWYGGADGKSKLRVIRDGKHWLSKSAIEWNAEIGLTEKQAYRSTNILKACGIIETKVMKFNGSPTVHIRLTASGEDILKNPSGNFHLATKKVAFTLQGKSLTYNTAENTTETTTDSPDKPGETKIIQELIGKDGKEEIEKKENIEKKFESAIGKLWKEQISKKYAGYQKELTKKEYGQLKLFKQKMGGKADEAITFSILNWFRFAVQVKKDKGSSCLPENPVIGFLLQYNDVIFTMLEAEAKNKIKAKKWEDEEEEMEEVEVVIAQSKSVVDEEEDYTPITPESIAAELAALSK